MTLSEIIESRQHKFKSCPCSYSCSKFQNGYETGWYWAYQDLKEILEQNGFNTNIIITKDKE